MNNIKEPPVKGPESEKKWSDGISDEELAFVKRFVLASGSLKQMAATYGVSYPTVRLRLDRLIEKIKIHDNQEITDEFERVLRTLYAECKIDIDTLKALLTAHGQAMKERQ